MNRESESEPTVDGSPDSSVADDKAADSGPGSILSRLSRFLRALADAAHGFHQGHSHVSEMHAEREKKARRKAGEATDERPSDSTEQDSSDSMEEDTSDSTIEDTSDSTTTNRDGR